jgi:hypothetical protein
MIKITGGHPVQEEEYVIQPSKFPHQSCERLKNNQDGEKDADSAEAATTAV